MHSLSYWLFRLQSVRDLRALWRRDGHAVTMALRYTPRASVAPTAEVRSNPKDRDVSQP